MNCIRLCAAALAVAAIPAVGFAQDDETPIITFRTNIYEELGEANHFSIFLGSTQTTYIEVDAGFGLTEVEINPAYYNADVKEMVASAVPITVSEEGIVKIYGNASKIDYLSITECAMTELEWSALTNLEIAAVDHNNLKSIDFSNKPKLASIDVSYNQFTEATPVKIGVHPDLQILYMPLCGYVDPNLDLKNYPKLTSFSAGYNGYLSEVDPTGCPNLVQLSITCTDVATLDLSKNPELQYLDISNTRMTTVDLSKLPKLRALDMGNDGTVNTEYKFSEVDVTNNPLLLGLGVRYNNLTELDLSAQWQLTELECSHNYLKKLDTGLNPLGILWCTYNEMNFNTLPEPPGWCDFTYIGQSGFTCDMGPYDAGEEIDFRESTFNDYSTTTATLYYQRNSIEDPLIEVPSVCYEFKDGILKILQPIGNTCFARFHNDMFYAYDQDSSPFEVTNEGSGSVENLDSNLNTHIDGYYSIDGMRLEAPVSGEACIIIKNGRPTKAIVK